ncbi:MAG: hypothetical protein C0624_03210 [Desulfuromonas sp.]|nr:MAG: hypothetical protein C0624_03210 [Desulfuromonas sp.]
MDPLIPSMMQFWTQLLGSLLPLLLSLLCLTASAYLVTFSGAGRSPQRKRSDLLLMTGNLLAIVSWLLIYADRLLLWHHPGWEHAAPLSALTTLVVLPCLGWAIHTRHRHLHLKLSEQLIYALSFSFYLLSLYPGIYTLGLYLALAY